MPTRGEGPEYGSKSPLSAATSRKLAYTGADASGLPAAYLAELPLATTLTLVEATPEGFPVLITTSKAVAERGRAVGACVLSGGELECLARGVAAERVYAATAREWFARKRREPGFRITLALTLDAEDLAADRCKPDLITIGAVLRALRLELEHVAVERDPVPCLDSNASNP